MAGDAGGNLGADSYRKAIAPLRFGWLQDEVKRGQYEESLVLFDRMLKKDARDADVLFSRGEVYRLRDDGGDVEKALADLDGAGRLAKAPAETFRSLGLLHRQRNDRGAAVKAFETYLAQAPQAPDADLLRGYLAEMQ